MPRKFVSWNPWLRRPIVVAFALPTFVIAMLFGHGKLAWGHLKDYLVDLRDEMEWAELRRCVQTFWHDIVVPGWEGRK